MADDFAKEVRDLYAQAEEADRANLEEAVLDLEFVAGEQWDPRDRRAREARHLPVITNNIVQQYTNMVVGDWLQNDTSNKVLPRENGNTETADVLSEFMRAIELHSKASRVYGRAFDQMVACGISNLRVDIDYANDQAFDKDIFIRGRPDPLNVRWDPLAFDPTARDAQWCFDGEEIQLDDYKRLYPDAALPSLIQREAGQLWANSRTVLVPDYWKMTEKLRTFGMTVEGKTVDLTDLPKKKWPKLAIDASTKQPIIREKVKCKYAVMVKTNGMEALSNPYELKLSRLPIVRVMGREVILEGRRIRSGLVRWMRDHQRMINYLASIRSQLLMKAARVNWIAPVSAIEGREDDYEEALIYEGNVAPTEVTGRNLAALLNEEQFLSQGIMNVTGIHEASRGMPSNETSGRAIIARQNEGDVATAVYHQNMMDAQCEIGEVVNELRPTVYDTTRTIRTVGPDLAVKMVRINDPSDPDSFDFTQTEYDVTISTGPSFATRRAESAAQLTELYRVAPQIAQVAPDIIVGEMDLVNGQELVERLKRTIPPQVLGDDANDGKSPEEIAQQQQAAAQAQQMQAMQVQMQMQSAQAELRLKSAQADEAEAKAAKAKYDVMQASGMIQGQPDPSVQAEAQRTAIMGYDAVTRRLAAIEKGNMPGTPPALEQHLAPIIANAVGQALAKHLGFAPVELGLPSAEPSNTDIPPPEGMTA